MVSGHVYIATSLDGYVARPDHRLDWLMKQVTTGEEHGYEAFMASVDGLVMGRGSFNTVLGFDEWPYACPVVVMSRTLTAADVPEALRDQVAISAQSPRELMQTLGDKGWKRAYIDGGRLVQSFIREGLVEDLIITTAPVLIGDGIPLFGPLDGDVDVDLELIDCRAFPSGLVQRHYRLLVQ